MAAGVIIGRVAVKVIPDTSRFKEELERDLNRIERDLDAIELDIKVDTDGVVREAKKARDNAQGALKDLNLKVNMESEDSVKRALGQLNRELERLGEVEVGVALNEDELKAAISDLDELLGEIRKVTIEVNEADPASVKSAVDSINKQLEAVRKQKIEVYFDEADLTAQRNRLRDMMDDTYREIRENVQRQMMKIEIGMDVDPVQAARTLRKIEVMLEAIEDAKMTITSDMDERTRFATLRKIQDMKDQVEDMKATIHPDLDAPLALALSARLAVLARDRYVEYVPRMNQAAAAAVGAALARMAGARLIGGYMRDLYNSIIQFDKAVPKIIGLSLAVGGLGIVGLSASSNLFALSASLASIAPAALALPGIFAGAAVGIGVLVAAMKDFNTVFPDVRDTLAEMQDSISTNFWAGARDSMREMLDTILPALKAGFDDVATSLGNFSSKFTDALTNKLAPALPGMFGELSQSIDIASGAADNIVGIITTLGEVGSTYLPSLAQWFVDITTQFDNFLSRSMESGAIFDWINTGIDALQDLARVGKNAGLILYDIAQAAQAAGGTSLDGFANALERIRAITSSAGFQTGLTEVFRSAHVAMDYIVANAGPGVTKLFESLGKLIPAILPTIGAAIGEMVGAIANALANPAVSTGIITMFEGIRGAIALLTPAFEPLAVAIATLGPLVADLALNLAAALGAAIPPVSAALVAMGDAIAPLIPAMGTLLLAAVEALTPVITNLSNAFVGIMEGGLLDLMVAAFTGLATAITAIPTSVLTILVGAIAGLTAAFMILSPIMTVVNAAMGAWALLWPVLSAAAGVLGTAIAAISTPVLVAVAAIAVLVAAGVALYKHWDDVKAFAARAWKAIKDEMTSSMQAAEKNIKTAWNAIKSAWDSSLAAIKSALTNAGNALKSTWDTAMNNLKTSARDAWNSLKSIWDSGISGIKSALSNAASALKSTWDSCMANLKSSASSAWAQLKSIWDTGVNGIKTALSNGANALKSTWDTVKSNAVNSAKAAWSEAVAAFRTGVSNAGAAARGLIPAVQGALSGAGTALVSAGGRIIDGFISGLRSGFDRVRSTLSSLTSMLPDWKGPRDRDKVLLVDAGRLVIGGFIEGMESQYDGVKKSLRGLSEELADSFGEPITADLKTNLPKSNVRQGLVGSVKTAVTDSTERANGKTLIYYAAPGSSLGSEEDLFAAADRGRMVGW